MSGRRRAVVQGQTRGRAAVQFLSNEIDISIRSLGLSYAAVGRDIGRSGTQVGRVAHGRSPDLSIVLASTILAAVGQELSVRAYPTGRPLRDTPQLGLLARFRRLLHPNVNWRTEVAVAGGSDLRAWDAVISCPGWRYGVEAETRLSDWQALLRRVTLKVRDGDTDGVLLVVWRTRSNATVLRSLGDVIDSAFPVPGKVALERLAGGVDPGGTSLILL